MLRTRARDGLCFVAYCNLVGGQDELVFDGRRVVIEPDGDVLARAETFAEDLLIVDFDPVARGRRPAARHAPAPRPAASATRCRPSWPCRRRRAAGAGRGADLPAAGSRVEEIWRALRIGLRDYVDKNGFGRVVIGLSGGIDSALVAALAADALGPERVETVSMPTRFNAAETRSDAQLVAERLGRLVPGAADRGAARRRGRLLPDLEGLAAENVQARLRGLILMALSNQQGWLVLTTGNKSETAAGFSTLYGDTAGGFAPIKDVPKTLVFDLAR